MSCEGLTPLQVKLVALGDQPHGLGLNQVQIPHRHLGSWLHNTAVGKNEERGF